MITLEGFRPLVEIIASERVRGQNNLFDDAVQEGLIAVWKVLQQRPDAPKAYLAGAARHGVNNLLRGRSQTGQPSRQGRQDAHDKAAWLPDNPDDDQEFPVPSTDGGMPEVELVDVRALVRAEVGGLAERDREQVYLRFWEGLTSREISARLGVPRGTIESGWVTRIRPALRVQLSELEDMG